MRKRTPAAVLACLVLSCVALSLVQADEDALPADLAAVGIAAVTTLGPQGDPCRSVDVVFLGDGFTADEIGEYRDVIDRMAQNFDTPPFDAHRARVNLHRVDLISEESGLSREGQKVSTRLGGTAVPFPGGKLLRCDTKEAARLARLAVPDVDYLMVVLNTHGKFLGSANSGAIVLLSTAGGHQRSIVVHEFAHNFAGLYDEYVDPKQAQGRPPPPRLRQARNVGLEGNVHAAKWHYWNIPDDVFHGHRRGKRFQVEDNVRCYEGGATFPDDVYRPEENCHMQRGRGKAFCRECTQALELALCRFFEPIESVSPTTESVFLPLKERQAFEVRPALVAGADDETVVRWYMDGHRIEAKQVKTLPAEKGAAVGPRYVYEPRGRDLGAGTHHLTVTVDHRTPRVRMDLGRLSASYTWRIEAGGAQPSLDLPEKIGGDVGVPVSFTARVAEDETWALLYGPEGASFDPSTGSFDWTPVDGQHGGWTFTFARADESFPQRSVPVRIRPAKKKPNRAPKPPAIEPRTVRAGEVVTFTLQARDRDSDHLAWSIEDLPAGATLDPNTGVFAWRVSPTAAGRRDLTFTCTDGRKRVGVNVLITVEGVAPFRGILRTNPPDPERYARWSDRLLFGLHHPLPRVRLANARALNDAPTTTRLAEALRLLREQDTDLHVWAAETLEMLFAEAASPQVRTVLIPLFLDTLPAKLWQFVDRPEDVALLRGLLERTLATEGLSKPQRKALEALQADLDAIAAYGEARRSRDPAPPITDKKFR